MSLHRSGCYMNTFCVTSIQYKCHINTLRNQIWLWKILNFHLHIGRAAHGNQCSAKTVQILKFFCMSSHMSCTYSNVYMVSAHGVEWKHALYIIMMKSMPWTWKACPVHGKLKWFYMIFHACTWSLHMDNMWCTWPCVVCDPVRLSVRQTTRHPPSCSYKLSDKLRSPCQALIL